MSAASDPGIEDLRPAEFARRSLAAVEVSDARRRRRARNTTPDSIGMAVKRDLLETVAREDPEPADFEGWLLRRCTSAADTGATRAMAVDIFYEWRLALESGAFREWLEHGAPSDDARG